MNKGSILSGAFGRWKSLLLVAALAVINLPALAAPITYTISGTGTGTVGATPFTGAAYTTITEPIIVFDNQNVSTFGFGRPGSDLLDLNDPAFATYALATNLGPISGLAAISLNQFVSLASTLGPITMTSRRCWSSRRFRWR